MTVRLRRQVLLAASGLVAGAIGAASLGVTTSQLPAAHASGLMATASIRSADGPSCPIPVGDQIKAVTAFGEMMPVFRHPRCANCHGDFDIRADSHPGAAIATDSGLDPRALLTAQERLRLHAGCGTCHDQVAGSMTRLDGTTLRGWLVAPQPMLWDGKTDEQLCLQMKRFETTGDQFVDHLTTDHNEVQFIKAAFIGDRALGADGLIDHHLRAAPPPGTQAALVAKARSWVDAVGNGYTASPECGCVMPKITLQIRHRSAYKTDQPPYTTGVVGFDGEVDFKIDLSPVDANGFRYQGRASILRTMTAQFVRRGCTGTATEREQWVVSAEVDQTAHTMTLQLGFVVFDGQGSGECTAGGRVVQQALVPRLINELNEIVIPTDSDAPTDVTRDSFLRVAQEKLTVRIVALPLR